MLCLYPQGESQTQKSMSKPITLFVNKASRSAAEILIYGYIGSEDGVLAKEFVKELRELEEEYTQINVRINSGGGNVYDGFAIFNAICNSKANVDTYIDGVAASMGSVIALAGKKCYMSRLAQFMAHRVTGYAYGNADQLRKVAEVQEQLEDAIAGVYARKTGCTEAEAKSKYILTGADKWMNATEALKAKMIDGVYDSSIAETLVAPTGCTEKEMWDSFGSLIDPPKNLLTEQTIYILWES